MENVQRKGVDVIFMLDVSKSMLARDIKPSRLERAKQLLLRLTDKLDNDRLGLILFAGRPYLQMPLTTDHGAARMYIQDASPDAVPTQGTVISEALQMANMAFNVKDRKYKSIVLISDGEDHDPDALKVAKQLAQDGVMINAIGIGTPDGSPIVDPATGELKKDDQGNVVMSKLNEAELQQLANATNGQYIRLDNVDDALITMTEQLDNAEKKSMTDAELIDYKSYFQWFLAAALLLLVIEFFLSERRSAYFAKRKLPAGADDLTSRKAGGIAAAATKSTGPAAKGATPAAKGPRVSAAAVAGRHPSSAGLPASVRKTPTPISAAATGIIKGNRSTNPSGNTNRLSSRRLAIRPPTITWGMPSSGRTSSTRRQDPMTPLSSTVPTKKCARTAITTKGSR